jgi:hypothetical protein
LIISSGIEEGAGEWAGLDCGLSQWSLLVCRDKIALLRGYDVKSGFAFEEVADV